MEVVIKKVPIQKYEVTKNVFFSVTELATLKDNDGAELLKDVPVVEIPMMSDYKWQAEALKERLEHPERYEDTENVPETVARLKKWFEEYETKNA